MPPYSIFGSCWSAANFSCGLITSRSSPPLHLPPCLSHPAGSTKWPTFKNIQQTWRTPPGTSNMVADLLSRPPPQPPTKMPSIPTGKIQVLEEPCQASTGSDPVEMPSNSGKLQDFAAAATTPINHQEMALLQILCQETQQLCTSTALQVISRLEGDLQLLGNISTGTFRPLVPACMRVQVLASVHNLTHLGTRATKQFVSARYVWSGMRKDCAAFIRD